MYQNNQFQELKEIIKAEAFNLGFCVIGFSTPIDQSIELFQSWIEKGYHAGMSYLAKEETIAARKNPASAYPNCKTIISLGAVYSNPAKDTLKEIPASAGRIANYASGLDYHDVLREKIHHLIESIRIIYPTMFWWDYAIDTKPLSEKQLAVNAGIGWIAKNGMLTHPIYGSALFLCEILLDIPLPPDKPFEKDFCGTCTRCLNACPTQCINDDRTINAKKCLSYLTIEHRGLIPGKYLDALEKNLFGCDICLQVCPWNKKAKEKPQMEEFFPTPQTTYFNVGEHIESITSSFQRSFQNSAIKRAGKQGFLRNCLILLSKNKTSENQKWINQILSSLPNSYLPEQQEIINEVYQIKKGS